jgi:dTDP-4-amino-4,6-dideoxygalactose transaminase
MLHGHVSNSSAIERPRTGDVLPLPSRVGREAALVERLGSEFAEVRVQPPGPLEKEPQLGRHGDAIAEQVRLWRNHGQKQRYEHVALGYNQRMTDLQAAIGLTQIEKLAGFTEQRIANAAYLTEHLSGVVQTPVVRPVHRHVYHQYTIRIPRERDAFASALNARGIGTGIHYPRPIHQQPLYQQLGFDVKLPVAEAAAREVISLPVHPALSDDDLATIAREVRALCQ